MPFVRDAAVCEQSAFDANDSTADITWFRQQMCRKKKEKKGDLFLVVLAFFQKVVISSLYQKTKKKDY